MTYFLLAVLLCASFDVFSSVAAVLLLLELVLLLLELELLFVELVPLLLESVLLFVELVLLLPELLAVVELVLLLLESVLLFVELVPLLLALVVLVVLLLDLLELPPQAVIESAIIPAAPIAIPFVSNLLNLISVKSLMTISNSFQIKIPKFYFL